MAAQNSNVAKLKQAETEIAVLQVQFSNLNERIEEVKTELKDLRSHIDVVMKETQTLIADAQSSSKKQLDAFQIENKKQHDEVNNKIASIEKWRWMMMGAGAILGAGGFPVLAKLLGLG